MPQVLAEWQPSSQWTLAERAVTWSALYAVILLGLFVLLGFEMGWLKRQKDIHQLFTERMKRVEARRRAKDWRGVGVEGTNLMNFVLGEISGQGGASLELDKLLLASPPSVRRELSGELTRVKERLELLSFAPEDLVGSQKEPKALKILVSELESTLGKAIKLGAKAPLPTEDLDHASV